MIYEWYTGSDGSKSVPRRLAELERDKEATLPAQRIKILRELLEIEEEANARGYLLWRIGSEHLREERHEEAVAAFLEAKNQFDPLLGTISGVMPAYCDTLRSLISWQYYDRGEMETVAELSSSIVANIDDAGFSDFNRGMTFFYQGKAFSALARKYDLGFLQPLALASYLKWHHEAPDDDACLEHLAYAYFRAGDMAHCGSAVKMCLEVAPPGEVRERMEEFAREHAREFAGPRGN